MKKSIIATLQKDYKFWKKGDTLSFSEAHYAKLKEEGYFKKERKVKKIAKEEDSEE